MVICYAALLILRLENGGLAAGETVECPHSSAVIRRAEAMSRNDANAGAVALAHIESPDLRDFEDAVNRLYSAAAMQQQLLCPESRYLAFWLWAQPHTFCAAN
jgi:hypothetical protein